MGVHDQRSQRMRQRFLESGLKGFADHEVLELLLYYAIPRREDGRVLTSAGDAAAVDRLLLRLSDGTLRCRVEAREI